MYVKGGNKVGKPHRTWGDRTNTPAQRYSDFYPWTCRKIIYLSTEYIKFKIASLFDLCIGKPID